jgi:hypothetical protein
MPDDSTQCRRENKANNVMSGCLWSESAACLQPYSTGNQVTGRVSCLFTLSSTHTHTHTHTHMHAGVNQRRVIFIHARERRDRNKLLSSCLFFSLNVCGGVVNKATFNHVIAHKLLMLVGIIMHVCYSIRTVTAFLTECVCMIEYVLDEH